MEKAEKELIKVDQSFAFPEELEAVKSGKCVKKSSPVVRLDPIFFDGLLRVGGRLNRATLPDVSKPQGSSFRSIACVLLSPSKRSLWQRICSSISARTLLTISWELYC